MYETLHGHVLSCILVTCFKIQHYTLYLYVSVWPWHNLTLTRPWPDLDLMSSIWPATLVLSLCCHCTITVGTGVMTVIVLYYNHLMIAFVQSCFNITVAFELWLKGSELLQNLLLFFFSISTLLFYSFSSISLKFMIWSSIAIGKGSTVCMLNLTHSTNPLRKIKQPSANNRLSVHSVAAVCVVWCFIGTLESRRMSLTMLNILMKPKCC